MVGADITKVNLSIKRISLVFKNTIPYMTRRIYVSGRHSDAFVYVIRGSCQYEFESGERFLAESGDVFYLPYKSVYTMQLGRGDYKFIYCDFEFFDSSGRPAIFKSDSTEATEALFTRLYNLYRQNPEKSHTECMSLLYSIYASLQDRVVHTSHKGDLNALAIYAKERIDEWYGNPDLSISALSREAKISEVYLRKLFKEKYGISPMKYLTSVRLKNAKKLMDYPFLSLAECSKRSGFSTVQYFGRVFLKEFGISPGQYRKEMAKK